MPLLKIPPHSQAVIHNKGGIGHMLTWTYLELVTALQNREVVFTSYTPLTDDAIAAIEGAERVYGEHGEHGLRLWYHQQSIGEDLRGDPSMEKAS